MNNTELYSYIFMAGALFLLILLNLFLCKWEAVFSCFAVLLLVIRVIDSLEGNGND